ncbi:MAG: hypothetical protein JNM66_02490 [Bryobacterales bacterium]|nr:hypothetical protein [Bryobacterales bacterium]
MADRPARPPVQLQYLMWDGTDPVDSKTLARELARRFRCVNLLDDSPATAFGVADSPRCFLPCGAEGRLFSDGLWLVGLFESPIHFFEPQHANAGGDFPAILQFSGHGIPGFMFSESSVLIAASRPLKLGSFSPSAGLRWTFIGKGWNNPSTKVVICSACRQLAGRPQQFLWSERMRGAAHRVHVMLSYRNTAPAAATSARINRAFVAGLAAGKTFLRAWNDAHGGGLQHRWAALVYRSAIDDTMREWVRDGSLPSAPEADEDILYFDEDTPAGRVVTRPSPDFNATMEFHSSPSGTTPPLAAGNMMPPWTRVKAGTQVKVFLHFLTSTFQDRDVVWVSALQVRPDYAGPFQIDQVIRFAGHAGLIASGDVFMQGRVHDERAGYKADTYTDLYGFTVTRAAMPVGTLDATFSTLTLDMEITGVPNDHLAVFYLMFRVERGNTEFGIPTDLDGTGLLRIANQRRLIDEEQFCVFVVDAAVTS